MSSMILTKGHMSNNLIALMLLVILIMILVLSANAQISTSSRHFIKVKATSYCLNGKNCPRGQYGGKTASGVLVGKGQIAVDPRIIPLGTVVFIESPSSVRGFYVATDTGSDIKGPRIDIWLPSMHAARQFGVRNAVLRVVKEAPRKHIPENIKLVHKLDVMRYLCFIAFPW